MVAIRDAAAPAARRRPAASARWGLPGLLLALLLSLCLVLSACGGGTGSSGSSSSGEGAADSEQYASALKKAEDDLKANAVDDPQSLSGPTTASSVAEVEPISDPSQSQLPVTLKDEQGTEVTVKDTSRILALDLYGTLAQTVQALGKGDQLVGRVTSSTQASLKDLPLVTENGHDLNAEAIMNLAPTVVLMDTTNGPTEVTEQLRSAGITVVHFSPDRRMDLIDPQIQKVAQALGVPDDGKRLGERVQKDLDAAEQAISEAAPKDQDKKVSMAFLYVRGNAGIFFVLGKGSGADDLVTSLSGVDVASEKGVEDIVPATSESLVKLDPDLILAMSSGVTSTGGIDGFLARPGVSETKAGQKKRIVTMDDGEILSFGPNTPAVLLSLAQAIYAPDTVSAQPQATS